MIKKENHQEQNQTEIRSPKQHRDRYIHPISLHVNRSNIARNPMITEISQRKGVKGENGAPNFKIQGANK